mmetsp:Transcript_29789/g.34413  ORF Transcript_29789/g.34413 Transcript_29789/m.34413 type:complete len:150 (+) Transcript_29789:36-485(+)
MGLEFLDKNFILKYVFRVLHIGPVALYAGKVCYDYLFGDPTAAYSKSEKTFYGIAGVLILVSGLVNTFVILQTKKNLPKENHKVWSMISHTKLLLTMIFFTPLCGMILSQENKVSVQFWLVASFVLISPFMRYYREYYTIPKEKQNKQQ